MTKKDHFVVSAVRKLLLKKRNEARDRCRDKRFSNQVDVSVERDSPPPVKVACAVRALLE